MNKELLEKVVISLLPTLLTPSVLLADNHVALFTLSCALGFKESKSFNGGPDIVTTLPSRTVLMSS